MILKLYGKMKEMLRAIYVFILVLTLAVLMLIFGNPEEKCYYE
mgnify:CR=1 FL=1